MRLPTFPRWLLTATASLLLLSACSGSSDSNPADGDMNAGDGDSAEQEIAPEEEIDRETAGEEETIPLDGDDMEISDTPVEEDLDLPAEAEIFGEYNPDVEFEPDIAEFVEIEAQECQNAIGTENCRYCGLPCAEDLDCPNGYTCNASAFGGTDGPAECTRTCGRDEDCGEGWSCHMMDMTLFEYPDVAYCVRGSGTLCQDNDDCLEGEVCSGTWPNKNWSDIASFCTLPTPCAGEEGDACLSDIECGNRWCLSGVELDPVCSDLCDEDTDCSEGRHCREHYLGMFYQTTTGPGPLLYMAICQDPNQGINLGGFHGPCVSDRDCSEGKTCGGLRMHTNYENLQLVCHPAVEGGAGFGEPCSFDRSEDLECRNLLCNPDTHTCDQACENALTNPYLFGNPDCPEGFGCYRHYMGRNPYDESRELYINICKPPQGSFRECETNADCSDQNEICAGLTLEEPTTTRLPPPPVDGDSDLADSEETDLDSESAEPDAELSEPEPEIETSEPEAEEGTEQTEAEIETELDAEPDATEAEEEAPDNRVYQAHCVLPVGPKTLGQMCSPTNSLHLCETGFCIDRKCSALCETNADCPDTWSCEERIEGGHALNLCLPPPADR